LIVIVQLLKLSYRWQKGQTLPVKIK